MSTLERRADRAGLGVERAATPPSAERAQAVYDAFVDVMTKATLHSEISSRLSFADIVAHVHLRDAPQKLALTLLFDRSPVEIAHGAVGEVDVELFIDTQDVLRFWTGDMHLAMAIAAGHVDYSGPVRKLLRIVPIARRLVADFAAQALDSGLAAEDERRGRAPLVAPTTD